MTGTGWVGGIGAAYLYKCPPSKARRVVGKPRVMKRVPRPIKAAVTGKAVCGWTWLCCGRGR